MFDYIYKKLKEWERKNGTRCIIFYFNGKPVYLDCDETFEILDEKIHLNFYFILFYFTCISRWSFVFFEKVFIQVSHVGPVPL